MCDACVSRFIAGRHIYNVCTSNMGITNPWVPYNCTWVPATTLECSQELWEVKFVNYVICHILAIFYLEPLDITDVRTQSQSNYLNLNYLCIFIKWLVINYNVLQSCPDHKKMDDQCSKGWNNCGFLPNIPRWMFGPKVNEVIGGWIILHDRVLHNICASPNI